MRWIDPAVSWAKVNFVLGFRPRTPLFLPIEIDGFCTRDLGLGIGYRIVCTSLDVLNSSGISLSDSLLVSRPLSDSIAGSWSKMLVPISSLRIWFGRPSTLISSLGHFCSSSDPLSGRFGCWRKILTEASMSICPEPFTNAVLSRTCAPLGPYLVLL